MTEARVRTEAAPAPFQGAPYSQAIARRRLRVRLRPARRSARARRSSSAGRSQEQTEQVFANLRAILEAAGSGLDRLVKTTVYLSDLGDFAAMNEVYAGTSATRRRPRDDRGPACPRGARRDRGDRARAARGSSSSPIAAGPRPPSQASTRPRWGAPRRGHARTQSRGTIGRMRGRDGHRDPRQHRLRRARGAARRAPALPGRGRLPRRARSTATCASSTACTPTSSTRRGRRGSSSTRSAG